MSEGYVINEWTNNLLLVSECLMNFLNLTAVRLNLPECMMAYWPPSMKYSFWGTVREQHQDQT